MSVCLWHISNIVSSMAAHFAFCILLFSARVVLWTGVDFYYHVWAILFYPITLESRRGTTDKFAITPFHLVLFSAALVELAKSIPVHSLI